MTVAVFVKVFDGIVLATDSATTVGLPDGSAQVYNNADKIFHLHRHLPLAAMTWGLGQIGPASISTLAKDLRRMLMGEDPRYPDWKLDSGNYTVEKVASMTAQMLHDRLCRHFQEQPASPVGMLVAGYSSDNSHPEAWVFYVQGLDTPPAPELVADAESSGWLAYAQPSATDRLFKGYDSRLLAELLEALPEEHHAAVITTVRNQAQQPVMPAMPFPDAIALAKYLVEVTSGYSHFLLGPDTVGGPVEVAGLNRHEGFKWINRKHYYSNELNQGA
ncbi:hypothetical protein [Rhodococcus sp. AG1013]|uniref:hypothetical protein n=1 Tax=Rhodococcus sp. AG1013 TaxID=2183996 RepID=UPI000E0C8E06|nr:hypothetical protein [Rhodococcus sp. AG1013]